MDEKVKETLEQIEKLGETVKLSQIPKETGKLLFDNVVGAGSKTVLELGTSAGYSTIWLAWAASKNNGKVYTIEKDEEKIKLAKKHFSDCGLDNIELIEGDILNVLDKWDKEIDFLFIDAQKSKYLEYFLKVEKFLKKGSVIVADNIKTITSGTVDVQNKTKDYVEYMQKNYESEIIGNVMVSK